MFEDDDLLPISALQHLAFCERQWGLMYLEGQWRENRLTVQGRHLHERAHEGGHESRPGRRITRGLRLCSYRLGLTGQADVVEFDGQGQPFPVEYKRGKPKPDDCDLVQLCAQALCLEEMLGAAVPAGAMFYGRPRRRMEVRFDDALRRRTEDLAARLHELTRAGVTPSARYEKKCRNCSLVDLCLPKTAGAGRSARGYLADMLANLGGECAMDDGVLTSDF
jgi:CRISPR-associated exonuclease Cas4